jgi:hypothetical protein
MATFAGNDSTSSLTGYNSPSTTGGSNGDITIPPGSIVLDDDPPLVYNFNPSDGGDLAVGGSINFDIEDFDPGVSSSDIRIRLKFENSEETLLVYDGTSFVAPFDDNSQITGAPDYWNVDVKYNYPWPDNIESFTVTAIDGDGNVTIETVDYLVPDADVGAPSITVVSPTPGVTPGSPGGFPADVEAAAETAIVLDVVDSAPGNRLVIVTARFVSSTGVLAEEVVYRRGQFRGNYIAGSTQAAIANGVRLTCKRDGGWPGAPTFAIDAVDQDGNLAA